LNDAWAGDSLTFWLSAALAFLIAGSIVAVDCWRWNSREFTYSTYPVLRDPFGLLFCAAFGALAAIVFAYAQHDPDSWLASTVTLKSSNPLARGALIGASVMVIVRSKVLQLGESGTEFGVEFFYVRGRDALLRRLRARQSREKSMLLRRYADLINRSADLPTDLDRHVRDVLRGETKRMATYDEEWRKAVRPSRAFAISDPLWINYNQAQTRTAIDFIGVRAVRQWFDGQ
jgi:hypothetical protein